MKFLAKIDKNLETFDVPEGTKEKKEWKNFVKFCSTPIVSNEGIHKMTPQEQYKKEIEESGGWLRHTEKKLDKCNHLMEFLRTFLGVCTLTLQVVILLKLFDII